MDIQDIQSKINAAHANARCTSTQLYGDSKEWFNAKGNELSDWLKESMGDEEKDVAFKALQTEIEQKHTEIRAVLIAVTGEDEMAGMEGALEFNKRIREAEKTFWSDLWYHSEDLKRDLASAAFHWNALMEQLRNPRTQIDPGI